MLRLLAKGLRQFNCRTDGQISIIVALALIPILLMAGLAVDLQRTTTYKSKVQYALDAAVIAGSKAKQEGASNEEIEALVETYLNAVLLASDGQTTHCDSAVVDVPQNSEDVNASISCDYPTTLSMAVGRDKMEFSVSSTSTYGIGNLDVAFVFDVSGSMGGSKMSDLQDAAEAAVDTLIPDSYNSENGVTRIAMTSYANMVDAGDYFTAVTGKPQNRTYTQDYTVTETEWVQTTCSRWNRRGTRCRRWNYEEVTTEVDYQATYTINDTCVHERDGAHAFNDAPPGPATSFSYNTPDTVDGDGNEVPGSLVTNSDDSYLSERQPEWDDNNNEWDGPSRTCSDHPPLPLTDNKTTLKNYIQDLNAGGMTAGHQGTMWGWYLISPHWGDIWVDQAGEDARPFDYDEPDTSKALIMMTDGSFNQVFHGEQGSSSQQAIATCNTAKANGVVIYTVAFQAPADAAATLEACASGPEYSHEPDNASELEDAYKEIATSISDLRIKF